MKLLSEESHKYEFICNSFGYYSDFCGCGNTDCHTYKKIQQKAKKQQKMVKQLLDWWIDNIPKEEIQTATIEMDEITSIQFHAEYYVHLHRIGIFHNINSGTLAEYRGIKISVPKHSSQIKHIRII